MLMFRRDFISATLAGIAFARGAGAHEEHARSAPFELPEEFLPRVVRVREEFAPGEIHVNPAQFALYLTLPKKQAIRYAVGVGRGNLYHAGEFTVGARKEWPSWKPTPAMMARQPALYSAFEEGGRFENGQPGGPSNPLGARALYLFDARGRDSYLRIHGTNRPRTIGTQVSNGCARLINEHIADLYERVPIGTRVVLYPKGDGREHA